MNFPIKLPPDLVGKPIADMSDLTRVLPYSPSGIRALVRKGRLPAPFSLDEGKDLWDFDQVLAKIQDAMTGPDNQKAA